MRVQRRGDMAHPRVAHAGTSVRSATRITAEEGEAGAKKDIEIQLAPDLHGKKTVGVVGSIIRV